MKKCMKTKSARINERKTQDVFSIELTIKGLKNILLQSLRILGLVRNIFLLILKIIWF